MTGYPNRIIFPLDVPTLTEAVSLARRLAPYLAAVKIGNQLFTAEGPAAVRAMHDLGLRVFLDLKFHDIPNTVAGAIASARALGVWMVNVHASGGPAMMTAAAQAVAAFPPSERPWSSPSRSSPACLTWTSGTRWARTRTVPQQVEHLARATKAAGLDGVVASPHEIAPDPAGMRARLPDRHARGPTGGCGPERSAAGHDPRQAIRAGADYLVVGRPIQAAADPVEAARRINAECGTRMRNRARSVRIRQTAFRTPHFAFETIESSVRGVAC